jgi:apolipoprotein N-acyltransferase
MTGGIDIEITLLLVVLAVASLWDAFMTIYGTVTILGNGPLQIAAALLFSALVLTLLLNTKRIMRSLSGLMGNMAKFFWFIAIFYDFFTSWVGNSQLIIVGERNAAQTVILIGLTLLVVSSPILLSELWERRSQISGMS